MNIPVLLKNVIKCPSNLKYKFRMSKQPNYGILAVTHKCNSKCMMCNFWKNKNNKNELTLNEIDTLFSDKLMKNLKLVALTGGEALLRNDLDKIIDIVHDKTSAKVELSTNGLLPAKLDCILQQKKDKIGGIDVSIDGLEETHNKVRGVKNAFKLALKSLKIIEKHNLKPTINMTLSALNYSQLTEVYNQFKKYNFTCKTVQNSEYYFGDNSNLNLNLTEEMKKSILRQIRIMDKSQINLYSLFLDDWLLRGTRPLPCYAGITSIYIDALGNVYPCLHKKSFGNIKNKSLRNIWLSPQAEAFRKTHKNCSSCYERCAVDTFQLNFFKWAIKSKIKRSKS